MYQLRKKNLADSIAIYGRGRELFRPPTYSLYKEPNIVEDIKIRRLEWAGHIMRIEEEMIPKKKWFKTKSSITQDQWEDQELDGRMWFRGMHYNCWG
jgi:hypothetical protein